MNNKITRYIRYILLMTGCLFLWQCNSSPSREGNESTGTIRLLIVGGGESHNFERWYKQADAETLEAGGFATVSYTANTDSIAYFLPDIDVLYLSNNQPIGDEGVRQSIFEFVASGGGLVLGHAALWYNWADWPEYNAKLAGGGSRGHDPYGSFNVEVTQPQHPVMEGVETSFTIDDELYYYRTDPEGAGIEVLATASAEGSTESYPSVFVVNHRNSRIAGIALGHDQASHGHAAYQAILKNAVRWAAGNKE